MHILLHVVTGALIDRYAVAAFVSTFIGEVVLFIIFLKEIVEYDIIPMLEEYWFDDEAKAKNWSNDLSGVFNG